MPATWTWKSVALVGAIGVILGACRADQPGVAASALDTASPAPGAASDGATCAFDSDGVVRCSLVGKTMPLAPDTELLLWVQPVRPRSDRPGWYLQGPPYNGLGNVDSKSGEWAGRVQIGNLQWPAKDGDTFDVALTAVDKATAATLWGQMRDGPVVPSEPVGKSQGRTRHVTVQLARAR